MIHEILQLDILDPEIISACGSLETKKKRFESFTLQSLPVASIESKTIEIEDQNFEVAGECGKSLRRILRFQDTIDTKMGIVSSRSQKSQ